MKTTIELGKIDYNNTGKKVNSVTVGLQLSDDRNFSAWIDVWNSKHTDILTGGQAFDTIKEETEMGKNPLFIKIYRLWNRYHLNDLNAGSPAQTKYLLENHGGVNANKYDEQCQALKDVDLLFDKEYLFNGKPYEFGSAWLTEEINKDDLQEIKNIIKGE